jgi:hypothetical protein
MVITGERGGRGVAIEATHEFSLVRLDVPTKPFQIEGRGDELIADPDAPDWVTSALGKIRAPARWRATTIRGGAEGLSVERPGNDGKSWLYDLWLAERLIESSRRD